MQSRYYGDNSGSVCVTCNTPRWIWRISIPVNNGELPAIGLTICDSCRRQLKAVLTDPRPDHEREVRDALQTILDEYASKLTEWEDGFLESITKQAPVFTDKQMVSAQKIIKKYLGKTI